MNELLRILLSERPLFITGDGYRLLVMSVLPYMRLTDVAKVPDVSAFFGLDPPTYKEESDKAFAKLKKIISEDNVTKAISVTNEYDNQELPQDTIAYHRVWGFVTADCRWCFSSKQLEQDLISAEQNPQISAHLLHVNSSGGEAWYLDRLSETMRSLKKPVFTVCENIMASAAYYIGCHGQKVYAVTKNDIFGSIGTMTSFHDYEGWYEKMGIKLVKAKATESDLKNKMTDDLINGKPKQFIEEILDPVNDQFLAEVRSQRPKLAGTDKDHPVLRGHVYYTGRAEEIGLIDGQHTLLEALAELSALVRSNHDMNFILENI